MYGIAVMFTLKLMFVKEIRETDLGVEIHFDGGRLGRLSRQNNDKYADSIEYAREGLKERYPVAATIEKPDRIVTIDPADSDTVEYLRDYDAERLEVAFRGHAAMYYLRKDHPDLQRVKATLEQSAKNQSLVWLSFNQGKMLVSDALPVEDSRKK
jgi:hypothetical protein